MPFHYPYLAVDEVSQSTIPQFAFCGCSSEATLYSKPSPVGEGGPLAVDEVSQSTTEPQRDGGPLAVDEVDELALHDKPSPVSKLLP